jgi:membrane fusion protein, peptide pheromone/bacteriocin exporter
MRSIIRNLKDLSDCKEVLETRPNPFLTIFIFIILIIVAGSIVRAGVFDIDVKIKANGIVRPDEKVSSIRNKINGKISYIKMENGMKVKKDQLLLSISKDSMLVEKANILRELANCSQRQNSMIILEGLLQDPKDPVEARARFNHNSQEYYLQYLDYINNVEKYNSKIKKQKESYEVMQKLYDKGGIAKDDIREAKSQLDSLELELTIYKNKTLMDVKNSIKEYNDRKDELETRSKSIAINIDDSDVKAPISGTINLINELNRGDLLTAEAELATIVPENNSQFKVYLSIKNKDIAELKIGQKVRYHFLAIPYKEYGTLTGSIINIGIDTRADSTSDVGSYFAEASIDNKPLFGHGGAIKVIKAGMICEAQLIVSTKKVLHYFLESIKMMDD